MENTVKKLQFTDSIPVLMLQSVGKNIVIPNVNVAEFANLDKPRPLTGAPEWFLGMVSWRGLEIPLISFEVLNGDLAKPQAQQAQCVVLNGIGSAESQPFYAMLTNGLPRQARITQQELSPDDATPCSKLEVSRVILAGEPGAIPDLELIETHIARAVLYS